MGSCPVRRGEQEDGEDMDGDYQDRAYRHAWEECRPDEQGGEEEQTGEGE